MHYNLNEAEGYAQIIAQKLSAKRLNCDFGFAPSFLHLNILIRHLKHLPVIIAAQDAHNVNYGAYTGSISVKQLADDGIEYTILGHSERRSQFGETDQLINTKLHAALGSGLKVVFCFGETLAEYETDQTQAVLSSQIIKGLNGLTAEQLSQVVLAYEPV